MAKKTHDLYTKSHHSNFMDMGPEEGPMHEKAESASKERKEEAGSKKKIPVKRGQTAKFPSKV